MNPILTFSPLLALVVFLSTEVSADTFTKYSDLKDAGFVNGFDFQWTVNVASPYTVSTTGNMSGCKVSQSTSCAVTPATWDNDDTVDIVADLPADVAFPAGMTPKSVEFRMCFGAPSTVNRAWRAIKDEFAKDNSCNNGAKVKVDWIEDRIEESFAIKSVTPTALYTMRAYVTCDNAGKDELCHVVNYLNADSEQPGEGNVFFTTEVMDSRPTNLYVAVIICAFIGPILLTAFLIYERGILAKQA